MRCSKDPELSCHGRHVLQLLRLTYKWIGMSLIMSHINSILSFFVLSWGQNLLMLLNVVPAFTVRNKQTSI